MPHLEWKRLDAMPLLSSEFPWVSLYSRLPDICSSLIRAAFIRPPAFLLLDKPQCRNRPRLGPPAGIRQSDSSTAWVIRMEIAARHGRVLIVSHTLQKLQIGAGHVSAVHRKPRRTRLARPRYQPSRPSPSHVAGRSGAFMRANR